VCEVRDNGERKYYFTNHPDNTPRMTLVRAIKARWVCEIDQSYCLHKSQCHARERDRSARSLESSVSSA
jgi:hypothetical protein